MSIGMETNYVAADAGAIAKACRVEFSLLRSVRSALRKALAWDVRNTGFTQKLCTVRFALKSLERHLQRMMDLEERGGYMVIVGDVKPNLRDRAERLQSEHDDLRCQFGRLMSSFETLPGVVALSAGQQDRFTALCEELNTLLFRLDRHEALETELLQDVLLCDEGGEG